MRRGAMYFGARWGWKSGCVGVGVGVGFSCCIFSAGVVYSIFVGAHGALFDTVPLCLVFVFSSLIVVIVHWLRNRDRRPGIDVTRTSASPRVL